MNSTNRRWAALVVMAFLCVTVLAWQSQTATGESTAPPASLQQIPVTPTPPAGGPGFYSQSAVAFKPLDPTSQWAYLVNSLYNPGAETAVYAAPLSLPHGATIQKFVVFFEDNSTENADLEVALLRCPYDQRWCQTMAVVSSSGSDIGFRSAESTSIWTPVIDNQANWYVSQATLPSNPVQDLVLMSIRVDYGYESTLPIVSRENQ